MPHDNHHRCDDCGALLAKAYPYNYCPKHWRQRYNAPPGESRIDYFEAAANLAGITSVSNGSCIPDTRQRASSPELTA